MRRVWIWLGVVAAVGCSLTAVATGAGASPNIKRTTTSVYFLNVFAQDPFWQAAGRGAARGAAATGSTLTQLDANLSSTTQASQFDTAMTAGAKVILLAAADSKAIIPSVVKARQAGIKVCAVNITVPQTTLDASISMAEVQGAAKAANYILAHEKKAGKKSITVLQFEAPLTQENSRLRAKGFDSVMKNPNPYGIKVKRVDKVGGPNLTTAASALQDVLTTTTIDAMYVNTDFYSPALVPVLQRDGYSKAGGKKHAFWVGVGGIPTGITAIRQGWQDATYNFPIDQQADACLRLGVAMANGQTFSQALPAVEQATGIAPKSTVVQNNASTGPVILQFPTLVTRANVNSPTLWANQHK